MSEGQRTNSLRYTGEQWDNDVGLLYLRARWYDPSVGRFTTRDPFLGLAGLPQTQHPYAYVGNNPVNLTDPSGKFAFVPLLVTAGGGAIIGGAASGILYAISHPCENLLNSASFWRAVGAGAVGGFVAGLLPIGGSLGAAIVWGMVGGAASATAAQLFVNLTTPGASWDDYLIGAAITGGVTGGIAGSVGYGIRQWLTAGTSPTSGPRMIERYGLRFTEKYYAKLWETGRKAPALVAKEILEAGHFDPISVDVASRPGQQFLLYRAFSGTGQQGWELVYNPLTREVYHIQPVADVVNRIITSWR